MRLCAPLIFPSSLPPLSRRQPENVSVQHFLLVLLGCFAEKLSEGESLIST